MDVVEVSPPYDQSEVTALLAYRVVMEALLGVGRPARLTMVDREHFELVMEALDSLPAWVHERLENIELIVEDRPPRDDPNLLGRYHGVPLTKRGQFHSGPTFPDTITLYKRTIERVSRDDEHLRQVIAHTVEHEVAHFFGISDDRLREIDRY